MKNAWATKIKTIKEWQVYTTMRARIWLRKHGRDISGSNVQQELRRIQENKPGSLSDQDVIEALERGDEVGRFQLVPVN